MSERIAGRYYKYSESTCEDADALAVLTRQGVVLLSDDACITQAEDRTLHEICERMVKRKRLLEKAMDYD